MKNILLDSNAIIQFKILEKSKLNEGVEFSNANIYITDVSLIEIKNKMQFKELKILYYMIKKYNIYLITLFKEKIKITDCRFIYNRMNNFSDIKEYEYLNCFYDFYKKNFYNQNKSIQEFNNEKSHIEKKVKHLNTKIKQHNKKEVNFIKEYSKDNKKIKKLLFSDFKPMDLIKKDPCEDKFKIKNHFNINEINKYSKYFNNLIADIYNNKIKNDLDYYNRMLKLVCSLDKKRILLDFKINNHKNMANDALILSYSLFFKLNLISTDIKMIHRGGFFCISSTGFFPIPILISDGKLKNIDKVAIFKI